MSPITNLWGQSISIYGQQIRIKVNVYRVNDKTFFMCFECSRVYIKDCKNWYTGKVIAYGGYFYFVPDAADNFQERELGMKREVSGGFISHGYTAFLHPTSLLQWLQIWQVLLVKVTILFSNIELLPLPMYITTM